MADLSSPTPSPKPKADTITAEKTVNFLGKRLRASQYHLHSLVSTRKSLEIEEKATRRNIRGLFARITRELDANPTLFREFREE